MPKIGCKDYGMCSNHAARGDSPFEDDTEIDEYVNEESFLCQLPSSPFKSHFDQSAKTLEIKIQKANDSSGTNINNIYFSPLIMDYLLQYRLPNLPLWSGIMKGSHSIKGSENQKQEIEKCHDELVSSNVDTVKLKLLLTSFCRMFHSG